MNHHPLIATIWLRCRKEISNSVSAEIHLCCPLATPTARIQLVWADSKMLLHAGLQEPRRMLPKKRIAKGEPHRVSVALEIREAIKQTANLPQSKISHLDILDSRHWLHLMTRSISVADSPSYVRVSFCWNRTDCQCWKSDWTRSTKKRLRFCVLEAAEKILTVKGILFSWKSKLPWCSMVRHSYSGSGTRPS